MGEPVKQAMYRKHTRYYDLIYSKKDYKKETEKLKRLIQHHKKSDGRRLLEVACGTGKHIAYLRGSFECTGVDLNNEMLSIARRRNPGVVFKKTDMRRLRLNKKYDVILCLFSSIGYVKTHANLKKTIHGFSKHMKQGGVVIIEPWLTRKQYKKGLPHLDTYGDKNIKLARASVAELKGNVSVISFHWLVAEKNKEVFHFTDRHELGLFDRKEMLRIMRSAGFVAKFLSHGLMKGRGLFIGIKK